MPPGWQHGWRRSTAARGMPALLRKLETLRPEQEFSQRTIPSPGAGSLRPGQRPCPRDPGRLCRRCPWPLCTHCHLFRCRPGPVTAGKNGTDGTNGTHETNVRTPHHRSHRSHWSHQSHFSSKLWSRLGKASRQTALPAAHCRMARAHSRYRAGSSTQESLLMVSPTVKAHLLRTSNIQYRTGH